MAGLLVRLRKLGAIVAIALMCFGCGNAFLPELEDNPWEVVHLDTAATLSDVAFTDDPDHGWLVGSRNTLMETRDGGQTWTARALNLSENQSFAFTSVSFAGEEGWVAGQPQVLLHTTDGGDSWE